MINPPLQRLLWLLRGGWLVGTRSDDENTGDVRGTISVLHIFVVFGFIVIVLHGWSYASTSLLWALACLAVGAAVGFLFGIPRIVQNEENPPDAANVNERWYRQRVNTNLEQISDWLTKIIVGLGLIHLKNIPAYIRQLAVEVAREMGTAGNHTAFASALLVYFAVMGFFMGYLLTRLFLAGAFSRADRAAAAVDIKIDALEKKIILREKTVEGAHGASATEKSPRIEWQNYVVEFNGIIASAASNREKLVAVAVLIEKMVRDVASKLGLDPQGRRTVPQVVDQLAAKGLIPEQEMAAFLEFWELRNQLVHNLSSLTDAQTARVLDLGWRLVRALA